jgi:hypothetical protein
MSSLCNGLGIETFMAFIAGILYILGIMIGKHNFSIVIRNICFETTELHCLI